MSATDTPSQLLSESSLSASALKFPVVGIGASAGGLNPLLKFFERMPADSGMAFVVIVHLSPKHVTSLPALLQASTVMRVVSPEDHTDIEANTVYVIPPNKMLSMNDSYLRLTDFDRPHGRHVAVDLFFRTLAIVHRQRAFAIVLSGTGTDGAVGITRIKEEGGVALAQQPDESEFDGMPRAAIATGAIDWVMPVNDMPDKLVELARNAAAIELPDLTHEDTADASSQAAPTARQGATALREILTNVRQRTGHDFRNYKRATVLRRIERRLQVHGLPNLPTYRAFMQSQPEEAQALLKDLLIGVTNFFRDPDAFEALRRDAIGALVRDDHGAAGVRVWVAGCATGEEAYSIAIALCEEAATLTHPPKMHVFATDIDEAAIDTARRGTYPASIETDVSNARLRRFFDLEGDQFRIRKEVREKVMFAVHNLLHDPPFSRLDLICCRNLLIYLDRDVHAEVLEMFHFALKPGGILFLGSSESADTGSNFFSVIDKKLRIYRANAVPRTTRYMPNLPMAKSPGVAIPPTALPSESRRKTFGDVHRRLIEHYAPASVLVDADSNIVHLSERSGRFLHHAAGSPSHNLLALVRSELRLELRTALFQALRSGQSVEARKVKLHIDGKPRRVIMIARPLQEPEVSSGTLLLVLFNEVDDSLEPGESRAGVDGTDPVLVHLEEELKRTKEQLQQSLEHSDTSTEELKASNEELQAINEELRSTTEELETSKEELQSINEELITVNHELKAKVDEMGKINDDLQNFIGSADIATLFVDRGMNIKRFTPQATKLFNLIPTDVGRSLLDITHRLDYERLADDAAEAFQSLRVIEREVRSQSGQWYLSRVLPYRTAEDRIDGAVLTFVDVTSRRKAEHKVRLIVDSTRDYAIATFDTDGRINTWNQGAERVFGYYEAEVVGQPISVLFVPEDRQAGVVEQELRRAREEGRADDDRWHLRKDGVRIYCSGITSPLMEDGELIGYAKIARDMTTARKLEQERENLLHEEVARRAEAQAANELKAEFLAVMSHELKNPLNLIQLNADLLSRLPEARRLAGVQRAAGIIRRTVVSQAQIIDDLFDLSRIGTGKMTLNRQPVDWAASVDVIAGAMREEAAARNVSIEVVHAAPAIVDADPVRLEQISWNLLKNAVKFSADGGRVVLRLSCEGSYGRLDVADDGAGIDPELLPQVFEMYRQAPSGAARAPGGLGIGLAVVKQMAVLHGGRVEARSVGRGRGATFSVWLPLADALVAPGRVDDARPHPRVAGRKVLLVDDDLSGVETLRRLLESEGMSVAHATTGADALRALDEADRVDLLISDVAMPQMDGHELIRAVRRRARFAELPALAMSGLSRPEDIKRALDAGYQAHIAKPVPVDRLLVAIEEALEAARGDR